MDIADEAQGVLADYRGLIVSREEIDKAISFFDWAGMAGCAWVSGWYKAIMCKIQNFIIRIIQWNLHCLPTFQLIVSQNSFKTVCLFFEKIPNHDEDSTNKHHVVVRPRNRAQLENFLVLVLAGCFRDFKLFPLSWWTAHKICYDFAEPKKAKRFSVSRWARAGAAISPKLALNWNPIHVKLAPQENNLNTKIGSESP